MSYQWVTLENTFPPSINRAAEWIRLRNGECYDIDMIDVDQDGVFRFATKPEASSAYVMKTMLRTPVPSPGDSEINHFFAYNRWWRIAKDVGYRLEYTALTDGTDPGLSFIAEGYDDYKQSDDTDIKMVVPNGEGKMYVLKANSGFVLSSCMGASTSFEKSREFYNIGVTSDSVVYSNAVIGGMVPVAWNGGGAHGIRHYMWEGGDGTTELSRMVRDISEDGEDSDVAKINWSSNLVIFDTLVYDLSTRKIAHYSGNDYATLITRAFVQPNLNPVRLPRLCVMTTGRTGNFDVTIEYGQAYDDLSSTRTKKFRVTKSMENRFRHEVLLETPITTRAFRIRIENLTGEIGVFQIDAMVDVLSDATLQI